MDKKNKLNDLTFASIMLAIFIIIHFVFPTNNRGIQSIMGTLTPIPIIIYTYCSNKNGCIGIILSGIILTFILYEPILAISFIIPNLLLGAIIGGLLKTGNKIIYFVVAALSIALNLYEIFINYLITGINFLELNIEAIDMSIKTISKQYENFNGRIYYDINVFAIPIVMIIGGFIKGFISLFISKLLLNRIVDKKIEISHFNKVPLKQISAILLALYVITIIVWIGVIFDFVKYVSLYSLLLDITIAYICIYSVIYIITRKEDATKNTIIYRLKIACKIIFYIFVSPILATKELINGERKDDSA